MKLSLCITNEALRHEGVWRSGCTDPRFLDLGTIGGEWSASRLGRFTPGSHCIRDWVGPTARLDDMEKLKFLTLPGLELRHLDRPSLSQLLYRLRYRDSPVGR
jgi:hypothetical protein